MEIIKNMKSIFSEEKKLFSKYKHLKGLTLIEILIVISLIGVLFVGLFGTYFQIRNIIITQSKSSIDNDRMSALIFTITKDIENVLFEPWNQKNYFFTVEKLVSHGIESDAINFCTGSLYGNPELLQANFYSVTYFTDYNEENGSTSLYRSEDVFIDYKKSKNGIPVPVMNNIEKFKIECSENGKDWISDWKFSDKKKLPSNIKFTISWLESGLQRNIDFQVTPGILLK